MRRGVIIALLLLLARPAAAEAPLDEATAAQLRALVDDAARAGLPAELLADKAREGVAKNVPPARIIAVVRSLGQALASARREAQPFVGQALPPSLLRALVEAHGAGASTAETQLILRQHGGERALVELADLLSRGHAPATAVREALSHAAAPSPTLDHGEPGAHGDVADDDGRGPNRETSGARGPRSGVMPPGGNKNHS
jgi:hypothetical protein